MLGSTVADSDGVGLGDSVVATGVSAVGPDPLRLTATPIPTASSAMTTPPTIHHSVRLLPGMSLFPT